MTYESLLHDLEQVYMYFLAFLVRFLDKIKEYPLIMLSLFILISLPVLYLIFSFISSASESTDDMAEQGFQIYRSFKIREQKRKLKEQNEAFKREKINRQQRAYDLAQEFFKNNPNRMSITIMGHKFYQDGFEKKNWSNSKKTRVTKKYKIGDDGSLVHSGTSISSTETYDNTSDLQLENNLDAD